MYISFALNSYGFFASLTMKGPSTKAAQAIISQLATEAIANTPGRPV